VQHCIKFFGSFASKAPENSEVATAVLEGLLEHLARYSAAADKEVRFHACQLLHQLLVQIRASVLSDDTVLDTLTDALTERLSDKLPAIRGEAVKGLCTLISFFEVGHPQLQLLLGLWHLQTQRQQLDSSACSMHNGKAAAFSAAYHTAT
jgi:hypothetical protein